MVNRDVVNQKLAELALRLARVRAHVPATALELAADPDRMDVVSFNLMLCIQACADIASHFISDAGWAPARTLAESFLRLHEHGVLTRECADALGRAAGMRNVIAHGYAAVNPELVFLAATRGPADLDAFAKQVASALVPPA